MHLAGISYVNIILNLFAILFYAPTQSKIDYTKMAHLL